jgi:hypothetical protein
VPGWARRLAVSLSEEVVHTRSHTIGAVVLAALTLLSISVRPVAAQQFSADVVRTPDPGGSTMRIYVGADKLRMQTLDHGQPDGSIIWDAAQHATTIVIDRDHAYIASGPGSLVNQMLTQNGAPAMWQLFRPSSASDPCTAWNALMQSMPHDSAPPHVACRSLGSESVNGRAAHKWSVTSTQHGTAQNGTVWIDDQLHVVSKSQDPNGTMQLENVRVAAQPDAVFQIPAGYRPIDTSALMGRLKSGASVDSAFAAGLAGAARDVGTNAANATTDAAKAKATNSVTKKLKGIFKLP